VVAGTIDGFGSSRDVTRPTLIIISGIGAHTPPRAFFLSYWPTVFKMVLAGKSQKKVYTK
jgi:hypothetical protein